MSDEKEQGKGNLRVLEFSSTKDKRNNEANKVVSDMFRQLSERAAKGDIEDFVITFKSASRGVESMIGAGGGVARFDFIGYIGMLEVLKQRLLGIMSQMTYAYAFEREQEKPKTEEKMDEQSTDPEKTDV